MKRTYLWVGAGLLFLSAAALGLIGFAHTKAGQPLLPYVQAFIGQPKSCPLGMDGSRPTPATVAQAYAKAAVGSKIAATKFVPDFTFGQTTPEEVKSFASERGGRCRATSGGTEFECTEVKTDHGTQTLWASFGDQNGLLRLKGVESIARVNEAAKRYATLTASIERGAGAPVRRSGSHGVKNLKSGLLYQASREYQFQNYMATVRVTNMGDTFAVTTHYYDPEIR